MPSDVRTACVRALTETGCMVHGLKGAWYRAVNAITELTKETYYIVGLLLSCARAPCVRSSLEMTGLSVSSATSRAVRSSASILR